MSLSPAPSSCDIGFTVRDTTSPRYLRRRANNNLSAKKSREKKRKLLEKTVVNYEQLKKDYNHLWREYDRLKTENANLLRENQFLRCEDSEDATVEGEVAPKDLNLQDLKLEDVGVNGASVKLESDEAVRYTIELRDSHHEVAMVEHIFFGGGL